MKNRNEQFLKLFGKNLSKILKSKGVKPCDIAAYSNMETKQIYRILNGEHSASISTIQNIAEGLEISIKELFDF